jgi:hypothetical protein
MPGARDAKLLFQLIDDHLRILHAVLFWSMAEENVENPGWDTMGCNGEIVGI